MRGVLKSCWCLVLARWMSLCVMKVESSRDELVCVEEREPDGCVYILYRVYILLASIVVGAPVLFMLNKSYYFLRHVSPCGA